LRRQSAEIVVIVLVGGTEAIRHHAADVLRRLQQDDSPAQFRGFNCRHNPGWRRAVDHHIRRNAAGSGRACAGCRMRRNRRS